MPVPMPPQVVTLLSTQAGVVSRRQLLSCGLNDHDIARLLRRQQLVRVHRSVYVDHTGAMSWPQQCWSAVLAMAPAALTGETALRCAEGADSRRGFAVSVAIPWEYRRRPPDDIRVVRMRDFRDALHPGSGIPRVRYERAVLDVLDDCRNDMDRVAQLSLAVNSRRTSAARLNEALAARPRIAGREVVEQLLADVESGSCSVLEHGYISRVERPHRLPATSRQVRGVIREGVIYRDAVSTYGVCLELDGRLHERADQRERDFDRDLAAAADGFAAVRLSYGQVFRRSCWAAAQLGAIYRARGWTGRLQPCGGACEGDRGYSHPAGAYSFPR